MGVRNRGPLICMALSQGEGVGHGQVENCIPETQMEKPVAKNCHVFPPVEALLF